MRFGAALDLRYEVPIDEFVDLVTGLGLDHVELRQGYLDVHPEAPTPRELRELAADRDLSYTFHAPFRGSNLANLNEPLREAAVDGVKRSLDTALAAGAGAVVVHGGSVPRRYPDRIRSIARRQAVRSLRECAVHADEIGMHLCVENQRRKESQERNTETPARLASFLDDVGVDSPYLGVTLDVGHAKVTGVDVAEYVETFGDRIRVVHLHDNDGQRDSHDVLPEFRQVAERIGAPFNVLEMKSIADIERCVAG
ncbi:sugar phosphate isomerase/epimerase family protein [Haloarchaeobius baliensis]|uniref:sugar phosphate isomerase/epimerase family protein n=1 Tax=Haloarchaeobius baliensis TaxID=1670458 RepID=UPI003F8856A5